MSIPTLSREMIQEHTAGGSYERGQQYLADGAVRSIKRPDNNTLKAQVQGSDVHPYLVSIKYDDNGIQTVKCSCPYHEGSWCKHIVAVLLKTLKQDDMPGSRSEKTRNLVKNLDRDEMIALFGRLVEQNPSLLETIQEERERLSA